MSRGIQEATFLPPNEWPEAGAWLEAAVRQSGLTNRQLLNKMGLDRGPNRLNRIFAGKSLPTPETLRKICSHLNGLCSYVEAVDRFGYYREIIQLFDDLIWLGECWMEEDDAYGRAIRFDSRGCAINIDAHGRATRLDGPKISRVDSIHYTGVLYWKGQPITWGNPAPLLNKPGCDPRADAVFPKRYFIGAWDEGPSGMPRKTPGIVRNFFEQTRWHPTIVPKPIAVAILLGSLAFPRRGDEYKEGAPQYRYDLGKAADALVREAKARRSGVAGRPKKIHHFLERACQALDDSSLPFNFQRPIAAEHVVAWADAICQDFTHYARLAAFDLWGDAGGRPSGAPPTAVLEAVPGETTEARVGFSSIFTQLPQLRNAHLPEIEVLTTYE